MARRGVAWDEWRGTRDIKQRWARHSELQGIHGQTRLQVQLMKYLNMVDSTLFNHCSYVSSLADRQYR